MSQERLFLDTVFIQALLNRRDQYHEWATQELPRVIDAREVWVTEAILQEVGNALASLNRLGAAKFIRLAYSTENVRIVSVDTMLFHRALDLFAARPDKEWGLTDCISFVVMQEHQLTLAMTADRHFVQAGFQIAYQDV